MIVTCVHCAHQWTASSVPDQSGCCRSVELLVWDEGDCRTCDVCDRYFNPDEDECQLGHDGPRGYVPSLCPKCLKGERS